jgi:hypothetical protein
MVNMAMDFWYVYITNKKKNTQGWRDIAWQGGNKGKAEGSLKLRSYKVGIQLSVPYREC